MKRIVLLSSAAIALTGGSALAQTFNFNGFYVGAQAGYGFGEKLWDIGIEFTHPISGLLAGGQMGFNLQQGSVVFGAELDWNWSNATGGIACADVNCFVDLNWLTSLTARVGAAVGIAMIYAEAGLGVAGETARAEDNVEHYAATWSNTGWTVGGGVEVGLAPGWSVDLEYGYWMFGTDEVPLVNTTPPPIASDTATITQTLHTIRLGVNFIF